MNPDPTYLRILALALRQHAKVAGELQRSLNHQAGELIQEARRIEQGQLKLPNPPT